MKRRTLKFIACAAVMALTLSVTACGGSDDSSSTPGVADTADTTKDTTEPESEVKDKAEEEVSKAEDVAEAETEEVKDEEKDSSEEAQTLEELFSDPSLKDMYDSMLEAMSEDGLELSYEVSGNDFVMIFTITDTSLVTDEMAAGLTEALETQGDQFVTQAKQFDDILGEEGASTVTIRYTDPDGNVMAEKTYTAK